MSPPDPLACLTNAQRRVLVALAAGDSYRCIASAQGISFETVRHHIRNAAARIPPDYAERHASRTRLLMWYAAVTRSIAA